MKNDEWDELAAVIVGGRTRSGIDVFRPITTHAERMGIRYSLTGLEVAELADFVRDKLDSWSAPPPGSRQSAGHALSRWCFTVADNRAKSVVRSRRRKITQSLEVLGEEGVNLAPHQAPAFNPTVLSVREFHAWLACAAGREDELALMRHRVDTLNGKHPAPLRWDSRRKKAVNERLKGLWRTFEQGRPMPKAKPRRARTQTVK